MIAWFRSPFDRCFIGLCIYNAYFTMVDFAFSILLFFLFLSSSIQQVQKYFMEASDSNDTRDVCSRFFFLFLLAFMQLRDIGCSTCRQIHNAFHVHILSSKRIKISDLPWLCMGHTHSQRAINLRSSLLVGNSLMFSNFHFSCEVFRWHFLCLLFCMDFE